MKLLQRAVVAAVVSLLFACSNPQSDWQKAEADNTEAGYQAFLAKYPEGEWAQKAQAQLDTIKDARDWETAQTTDNADAYNNYLTAHGTGTHVGEARQRIAELERDAAWAAAQQAGTKQALEEFLTRHPDAPQADQARSQIAALNPPPPPPPPKPEKPMKKGAASSKQKPTKAPSAAKAPGGSASRSGGEYVAQLGAFSSMEKARAALATAEKRDHTIVGSLSIQKPAGANRLYRLRSVGMSEAAARSACQKLKGSGQDCVVVHR
jgi:cell division septation protein DedD